MIAVLDIGKTNVKLTVATDAGAIVETLSTPNAVRPGPPFRHHDLTGLEAWLATSLRALGRRYRIEAIVPCGHGSGGVLVDDAGPAMPMIDYEDEPPAEVKALYPALAGGYRQRGSPVMLGASHVARQMLWLETVWPEHCAAARAFLTLPQYWAWRLCGIAASEVTCLGAQSHLWSAADRAWTPIVAARGWQRLLPPIRPAWTTLGMARGALAQQAGLGPQVRVLCGIHDSSANFYRYQAAGLRGLTVVSTGTWIVALTDAAAPSATDEARGITYNADPAGRPLLGALCMGGREYALIAGDQPPGPADPAAIAAMIRRGSLAVPCFGEEDGLFPGRAHRGGFIGPPPETPAGRRALALVTVALLTDLLLDRLCARGDVVLDGSFAADPAYPALLAALRPEQAILCNLDSAGPAAGAALLAGHQQRAAPVTVALQAPPPLDIPGLTAYRATWRRLTAEPTETAT